MSFIFFFCLLSLWIYMSVNINKVSMHMKMCITSTTFVQMDLAFGISSTFKLNFSRYNPIPFGLQNQELKSRTKHIPPHLNITGSWLLPHRRTHVNTHSHVFPRTPKQPGHGVNLHISGENVTPNKPTLNKQSAAGWGLIRRGWTLGLGLWSSSLFWTLTLNNTNIMGTHRWRHTCALMVHSQNVSGQPVNASLYISFV